MKTSQFRREVQQLFLTQRLPGLDSQVKGHSTGERPGGWPGPEGAKGGPWRSDQNQHVGSATEHTQFFSAASASSTSTDTTAVSGCPRTRCVVGGRKVTRRLRGEPILPAPCLCPVPTCCVSLSVTGSGQGAPTNAAAGVLRAGGHFPHE